MDFEIVREPDIESGLADQPQQHQLAEAFRKHVEGDYRAEHSARVKRGIANDRARRAYQSSQKDGI
jgi:hypothetical protein